MTHQYNSGDGRAHHSPLQPPPTTAQHPPTSTTTTSDSTTIVVVVVAHSTTHQKYCPPPLRITILSPNFNHVVTLQSSRHLKRDFTATLTVFTMLDLKMQPSTALTTESTNLQLVCPSTWLLENQWLVGNRT